MRKFTWIAACLTLSCAALLPKPATPSARPGRLLGSAHASFARGEIGTALDLTRQSEHAAAGFDD
ncbi:MAG: hypothetical protein MUE60_14295, partial [Candidatus Eisenbacteria bacterium]|nr:hypothetical protein [Candidatus Eisenbacteria bacterium]